MKKLISLALCLCMAVACFATMIVSVAAGTVASIPNAGSVPTLTKGERIYYETFESTSLDTLTNENLMSTLGWFGTLDTDNTLSIVSEDSNHAVCFTAGSGVFDTVRLLQDDRLYGGDYIVEFTARSLSSSNSGRTFGIASKRAGYAGIGYQIAIKDRGEIDHFMKFGEETSFTESGSSLDISTDDNTLVGDTIRYRIVVDSDFGVSLWTVNGESATLVSATTDTKSATWKADCAKSLGNELYFRILSGLTVAFDDIEVWTTTKVKDGSIPQYIGFQTSTPESNLFDVRFIAGISDLDAKSMGYQVGYQFTRDGQTVTGTKTIYCEYVYTSISAGFGTDSVAATDYGYNYMMALHINSVPSNIPVTFTVSPFAVIDVNGVDTIKWSSSRTLTVGEAPSQNELLEKLPAYTGTGQYNKSESEFSTGYYRVHYQYANLSSYNTYLNTLTSAGFTLHSTNELDGNLFNTFYNNELIVHAYYTPDTGSSWWKNHTITLLVTDAATSALHPTAPVSDEQVVVPTLTMMDLQYESTGNNGMGFVYTLEDGSYVIIDGGYGVEADVLYNYLVTNNKREDGKVLIRAWIITHVDGDHIGAFNAFSPKYADQVTLEYFVAQFDYGHMTGSYMDRINTIYANEARYTGCKNIVPMAGQVMYFGTLKVEFFYTAEMYENYAGAALTGTNESSLAFKAYLGDTSVFFAGDIVGKAISLVADRYSTSLKSDILQLPHHGLNGSQAFYTDVAPETVLFCTGQEYAEIRMDGSTYETQNQIGWLLSQTWAPDVLIADGGNTVLEMANIPTLTPGDFTTQKDSYTFEELFGSN